MSAGDFSHYCICYNFEAMYIPQYFKQHDLQLAANLVKQNEFGIFIAQTAECLQAVHIPFLLKENGEQWILYGHFSAANQLTKVLGSNQQVLIIFQGAHAYVSSSWYKNISVPTWNYSAVHCYGKPEVLGKEETEALLQQTMNYYESFQKEGMKWETLPEKLKENLMKEMVAFKMIVDKIEAKAKLSQNKSKEDFHSVIQHLEAGDTQAQQVANEMKKLNKK